MNALATVLVLAAGVVPPFGAIAVIVWAYWSRTPWEQLGFSRPASWRWTVAGGLVLGVALKLTAKAVVLPALGAPPTNPAYAAFAGNAALLPQAVFLAVVMGGIAEEIFWRGFLFQRLRALLGDAPAARVAIVAVTALAFALAHYAEQGVQGVEQGLLTGAVFGTLFAATGILWPVMIAHAAYDLTAFATIYLGLETATAHLVFK